MTSLETVLWVALPYIPNPNDRWSDLAVPLRPVRMDLAIIEIHEHVILRAACLCSTSIFSFFRTHSGSDRSEDWTAAVEFQTTVPLTAVTSVVSPA